MQSAVNTPITIRRITIIVILGRCVCERRLVVRLIVPAVFALSRLGARAWHFIELQKWGFDFPQGLADYGAGFVLGNAETRLVDLAAAYAGLARGGTAMRAKFLTARASAGDPYRLEGSGDGNRDRHLV